ncbi:MAG: hypothetical protein ACOYXT_19510 [Bacteroidota bacterium]
MESTLSLLSQIGFIVLTIIYFGLLIREFKKGIIVAGWTESQKNKFIKSIIVILVLWSLFVSFWSLSGIMSDFTKFPFNFMPVILIPLVGSLIFVFSKGVGDILKHIPSENILRLQSFRFFVELILWALFVNSLLPIQMTFEGRNFDILAGITGPIIGWFAMKGKISKTAVALWNIACLGLLINIVTIAILSTPTPVRVFMNEPANTIVAHFPASWLPGFLVPLAYTLHFLSLRQMFLSPRV